MSQSFLIKNSFLVGFMCIFIACSSNTEKNNANETTDLNSEEPNQQNHTILHQTNQKIFFSSSDKEDVFQLKLLGKDTLDAQVLFQIFSADGDTLYQHQFHAMDLINFSLKFKIKDPNRSDMKNFITERMSNFFASQNFSSPAVKADRSISNNILEPEVFEELKKDTNSISYTYVLHDSDVYQIAYSKSKKKIVLFYKFDNLNQSTTKSSE